MIKLCCKGVTCVEEENGSILFYAQNLKTSLASGSTSQVKRGKKVFDKISELGKASFIRVALFCLFCLAAIERGQHLSVIFF